MTRQHRKRVVIAMSGGVDSSVAAARLLDNGFDVIGVTLHLWEPPDTTKQSRCCAPEDVRQAQRVADMLNFPHYSFDRRELFDQSIVNPFVDAYLSGTTPSPCARCNHIIKIPTLLGFARLVDATSVATGHYAQLSRNGGVWRLSRGLDRQKDQSYFLSTIDTQSLRKLLFPLGRDTKASVRNEAARRGIAVAGKSDSQDLCFVPDGSYVQFVEQHAADRLQPGWFVDVRGRKLGQHAGVHRYTIGQRRGIGISTGRRLFVRSIDAASGLVVVDDVASGCISGVVIDAPTVAEGVVFPLKALLQVRYKDAGAECTLERLADGSVTARLDRTITAASVGQLAVGYVGNDVVVGGTISRVM